MVIDTSALVAVLLDEANAAGIAAAIAAAPVRLLSGANLLEASMVIESRKGAAGGRELDLLLYRAAVEVVAVDQDQAETARSAWRRYGKGRHPAGLNSAIALPMRWPRSADCRCCFKAAISDKPTSSARRC
jgi:ribonuclease VapC